MNIKIKTVFRNSELSSLRGLGIGLVFAKKDIFCVIGYFELQLDTGALLPPFKQKIKINNIVYVVACQRESRVGHYYYIKHSYLT